MVDNKIKMKLVIICFLVTGLVNGIPIGTKNATSVVKVFPTHLHQPCFLTEWFNGVMISLAILISNCLILRVIWVRCVTYGTDSRLEYLILGSLSMSDILVGVFSLVSLIITNALKPTENDKTCTIIRNVNGLVYTGLITVSIGNICLLATERFTACIWCFEYHRLVTKRRILSSIAVTWIGCIVLSSSAFIYRSSSNGARTLRAQFLPLAVILLAIFVFTGAIFLTTIYSTLYFIARKKLFEEQRQQRASRVAFFGKKAELRDLRKRKFKSTLASFVVSFSYLMSFVPFTSFLLLIHLKSSNKTDSVPETVPNACTALLVVNPVLDPFIYILTIKIVRKDTIREIKRMVDRMGHTDYCITSNQIIRHDGT